MRTMLAGAALASVLSTGCGSDSNSGPEPPKPTSMTAVGEQRLTGVVGSKVAAAPAVKVADAGGNPVAGVTVRFDCFEKDCSVESSSATTNSAGVASAGAWTLGTIPGDHRLVASSTGLPQVTFVATAGPGPAARLAWIQQPTDVVSLQRIPAVRVQVRDQFENLVPAPMQVTVALNTQGGGGSLSGTLTRSTVDGVATFDDLAIDKAGTLRSLTATTGALSASSDAFAVKPGPPATIRALDPFPRHRAVAEQVDVRFVVEDAAGNYVPNVPVTFEVAGNRGSFSSTYAATSAVFGDIDVRWTLDTLASLGKLNQERGGKPDTLWARAAGVATPAVVTAFKQALPASRIFIEDIPSGQPCCALFSVPVSAVDRYRNFGVYGYFSVTLELSGGPEGAVLGGTTAGEVLGTDYTIDAFRVSIDRPGDGYRITARSSAPLSPATSNAFSVRAP